MCTGASPLTFMELCPPNPLENVAWSIHPQMPVCQTCCSMLDTCEHKHLFLSVPSHWYLLWHGILDARVNRLIFVQTFHWLLGAGGRKLSSAYCSHTSLEAVVVLSESRCYRSLLFLPFSANRRIAGTGWALGEEGSSNITTGLTSS